MYGWSGENSVRGGVKMGEGSADHRGPQRVQGFDTLYEVKY